MRLGLYQLMASAAILGELSELANAPLSVLPRYTQPSKVRSYRKYFRENPTPANINRHTGARHLNVRSISRRQRQMLKVGA